MKNLNLIIVKCAKRYIGITLLKWADCFIYFNWRLITLQYCSVFLPCINMNQPWVYMCSPSWTPLLLPSPSHTSGSSPCTSPKWADCFNGAIMHTKIIKKLTTAILNNLIFSMEIQSQNQKLYFNRNQLWCYYNLKMCIWNQDWSNPER